MVVQEEDEEWGESKQLFLQSSCEILLTCQKKRLDFCLTDIRTWAIYTLQVYIYILTCKCYKYSNVSCVREVDTPKNELF